jgi:hypothetical protein
MARGKFPSWIDKQEIITMAKRPTLETIDVSLRRWKTRLKRAVTAIDKLEKQKKRLLRTVAKITTKQDRLQERVIEITAVQASLPAYPTVDSEAGLSGSPRAETTLGALPPPQPTTDDALDIPVYLRRQPEPTKAWAPGDWPTAIPEGLREQCDTAEQIRAEQAEIKKKKAQGRIAKMKAKKAGDLNKMPLTGRAALDAIKKDD